MWKSFTTGKSSFIGGIPHDVYGMTTRSVRSYVKGIQNKLGLIVFISHIIFKYIYIYL